MSLDSFHYSSVLLEQRSNTQFLYHPTMPDDQYVANTDCLFPVLAAASVWSSNTRATCRRTKNGEKELFEPFFNQKIESEKKVFAQWTPARGRADCFSSLLCRDVNLIRVDIHWRLLSSLDVSIRFSKASYFVDHICRFLRNTRPLVRRLSKLSPRLARLEREKGSQGLEACGSCIKVDEAK